MEQLHGFPHAVVLAVIPAGPLQRLFVPRLIRSKDLRIVNSGTILGLALAHTYLEINSIKV
jgi:hypothetical protein